MFHTVSQGLRLNCSKRSDVFRQERVAFYSDNCFLFYTLYSVQKEKKSARNALCPAAGIQKQIFWSKNRHHPHPHHRHPLVLAIFKPRELLDIGEGLNFYGNEVDGKKTPLKLPQKPPRRALFNHSISTT